MIFIYLFIRLSLLFLSGFYYFVCFSVVYLKKSMQLSLCVLVGGLLFGEVGEERRGEESVPRCPASAWEGEVEIGRAHV